MCAEAHPEDTAAVDIPALRRQLAALRLNRLYPPWRAVDAHLAALQIPAPDAPLVPAPGTAWPEGAAWTRVRVDHGLAPELLSGVPLDAARTAYLRAIAETQPLPDPAPRCAVVGHVGDRVRGELVWDRHLLPVPRLWRATLRFVARPSADLVDNGLSIELSPDLRARLRQALERPAAVAWTALEALVEPELLTLGELGPARPGPSGPWLSAALSRVGPSLRQTSVDDPLLGSAGIPVPAPSAAVRLSHHRKWAVPADDLPAARAWLKSQGSRNLVVAVRS